MTTCKLSALAAFVAHAAYAQLTIPEIQRRADADLFRKEAKQTADSKANAVTESKGRETVVIGGVPTDQAAPTTPGDLDPETRKFYNEGMREYYRYRIAAFRQRTRVFEWQLFSSELIFVTVLLLVFTGVYFAAVQFHLGLRHPTAFVNADQQSTEIAASLEGIRANSSVLGVIVLVISMAFFASCLLSISGWKSLSIAALSVARFGLFTLHL